MDRSTLAPGGAASAALKRPGAWSGTMSSGIATAKAAKAARGPAITERKPARQEPRIPHRVPCRVSFYDPQSHQPTALIGQTTNISRSGFAVQVNRDVPSGAWIEALVPQPSGHPLFFCGVVAHSRRVLAAAYEIGIEFVSQPQPAVF